MSASDARRALQVKGQICWNPTDLSTTFPFGGTELGFMKGHSLKVVQVQRAIRSEHLGVTVDTIRSGEDLLLAVILASWDADAMPILNLDATAGAVTGRPVLRGRPSVDNFRQGELGSARSGVLYFSPDADQHPGVLFYKAIPMLIEDAEIQLNLTEQFGLPMVFTAVPDDSERTYLVGLREDLSL